MFQDVYVESCRRCDSHFKTEARQPIPCGWPSAAYADSRPFGCRFCSICGWTRQGGVLGVRQFWRLLILMFGGKEVQVLVCMSNDSRLCYERYRSDMDIRTAYRFVGL